MSQDSTKRFTDRVADYTRYRPSYPAGVLDTLHARCGPGADPVVADVGAGTGIFSALLAARGHAVRAVEPNDAMREALAAVLGTHPRVEIVAGTSEATGLDASSVDLVTAAQAFHWFDPQAARREFARILRPGGYVALVWNQRDGAASAFQRDYESLVAQFGIGYDDANRKRIDRVVLEQFFAPDGFEELRFENAQRLDLAGLTGRLASSSYMPSPGHRAHAPMTEAIDALYRRHEDGGAVELRYTTHLFLTRRGSLS